MPYGEQTCDAHTGLVANMEHLKAQGSRIETKVDSIDKRLGNGAVDITKLHSDVSTLKRLVWPVITAIPTGLIGALIYFIVRGR